MHNPFEQQIAHLQAQVAENEALMRDPELQELARSEIAALRAQIESLLAAAEAMNVTKTASTDVTQNNCIIEMRAGAGGDEAKLWGDELLHAYIRFAESHRLKVEYLDTDVIKISGRTQLNARSWAPYQLLRFESGVHRVQRIPVTESMGRIHTSTASLAVYPEVAPHSVQIKEADLQWQFTRAGGAGGQNVNKVNSAVRLTHIPTGIVVQARQERKQAQNRQIALQMLASKLWEIEEE